MSSRRVSRLSYMEISHDSPLQSRSRGMSEAAVRKSNFHDNFLFQ